MLNVQQKVELLQTLKTRFQQRRQRHQALEWSAVQRRLEASPRKLQTLYEMEATGGEPDVIAHDSQTGEFTFCDCSAESPAGRRSACYDREALASRKENRPAHNVVDWAAELGITLLNEAQYRGLQALGEFDQKTSSWIATPPEVRALGGALFCDRRYGQVFTYHNGAQSYYAARGFRGWVRV